jgi:hypothetical protein
MRAGGHGQVAGLLLKLPGDKRHGRSPGTSSLGIGVWGWSRPNHFLRESRVWNGQASWVVPLIRLLGGRHERFKRVPAATLPMHGVGERWMQLAEHIGAAKPSAPDGKASW